MKRGIDPRVSWWWSPAVQTRLIQWTLALLNGRRYTIRLSEDGTGFHDPENHVIQANPQLFKEEEVENQFLATQGILTHEVGHAVFTDEWPEQKLNRLCEIVNILEDERIERCISTFYPGVVSALKLLGDLMLSRQNPVDDLPDNQQAYVCCLVWRWAHSRISEKEMLTRMRLSAGAKRYWKKVRALVEDAWELDTTRQVIDYGREILQRLEMREEEPALKLDGVTIGIGKHRDGKSLPRPDKASGIQPGKERYPDEECSNEYHGDDTTRPAPYTEIEDQARPIAFRLQEELKVAQPDTSLRPHDWQGRYSFRQDLRTSETPNLARSGVDRKPRSLAMYLLVDRSGSMWVNETEVRLSLMAIYLAANGLAIPNGIAYFGKDEPDKDGMVLKVSEISTQAQTEVKALIAGYTGTTENEFLDWGLTLAERELRARPERLKVMIIIHDGEPVYKGSEGNDWNLSYAHIRQLDRQGITPIGLYLGDDPDYIKKLKSLFPRLVICKQSQLPEKLGNLLRSLA